MKIALLNYNKPIIEAFDSLELELNDCSVTRHDFKSDTMTYEEIDSWLSAMDFDVIITGDIFWPTGQNICLWAKEHDKRAVFLQHGQWIYTKNKTNPRYLPSATFLFGDDITRQVKRWPYGRRSNIYCTGTPRYEFRNDVSTENFIYFSPPVIEEMCPPFKPKINHLASEHLANFRDLDRVCDLVLHPHYREGNVQILSKLFPRATLLDRSENALLWIRKCRAVITHRNSTAVLDAIAASRKTVLMNLCGTYPSAYKTGYFGDLAVEPNNIKECFGALESDLSVSLESYRLRTKPYIFLGNASRRIMSCLKGDRNGSSFDFCM